MKTVTVLLLLVIGSFALQTEAQFAEFMNIDQNQFGKTLLDTIQLQLDSKSPVDQIVKQLVYIENQLIDDQRKSDQAHQAFQDKCDEEIQALEADITRTKAKKADLENEIDVKTELLRQKKKRRADLQQQQRKINAEIRAAIANRRKEAQAFDQRVKEHEYASYVVNQAKKMFDKAFSGSSFLQTQSETTFDAVTKHFEMHSKDLDFKHTSAYTSLFKVFSQITGSKSLRSDKGMVGRIYKLFDETLAHIEDSLTNERRAEDKRIQIFKKYKQALEKQLSIVERDLARVNVEIIALENRLREAKQELTEAIRRIYIKEKELADKQKECDDEAEAYKSERAKRDEKKNIVSQLIGLIQSKLRRLRAYARRRGKK